MNVTLNASERLNLLSVIPSQVGSIDEMIAASAFRKQIALTEKEQTDISFVADETSGAQWDNAKAVAYEVDFDFSESDCGIVLKGFELLASEGRLPTSEFVVQLYQKFND